MLTPPRFSTCQSRRRRSNKDRTCSTLTRSDLAARLLGLAAEPLCLAARLLGGRKSRLGLGARPLRVDSERLRLCRWLLRLFGAASRHVFAPVYFDGGLRTQRGFSYSPSAVINPGVFASHLFLRPGYGHYYFGDYYGSNYADAGFSPWFSYQSSRRGYDPIYANQRWQHRQDRDWEHRTASNFRQFSDHADTRPPHTWAAQKALEASAAGPDKNRIAVATSLDDLARRKDGGQRFQSVNNAEQQQFSSRGQEYRKFLAQRQQLEGNAAKVGRRSRQLSTARTAKLPRSPFVAAPVDQLGGTNAPPKRHEVLKPVLETQPQSKRFGETQGITNGQKPTTVDGSQQNQVQRKANQQASSR